MKQLKLIPYLLLFAISIFNACKKDISCEGCQGDQPNQPIEPTTYTNKAPIADAGTDQTIVLPKDSILLNGSASTDPDGRITRFQWQKISGPTFSYILHADSAQTWVTNLAEGSYLFELTVKDSLGLFHKDTTIVTVIQANPNEIIFNNQMWQCWWGCWIEIPELYNYVPANTIFRVFIRRDNSAIWEEAIHGSQTSNYGFLVDNSSLVVYMAMTTNMDNDTPDIKIVY